MSDEPRVVEGEVVEEEDVTPTGHEVVRREDSRAVAIAQELSVDDLMAQVEKVRAVADRAMTPDVHYGKIPGTDKPTLLKPGAEKLQLVFRLAPRYRVTETWHDDGHLTVDVVCELYHVPTGNFMGEGVGLCSTRETKYAYRNAGRVCPDCGEAAIIKGKEEYGGGWLCFKRKGGCGNKWPDNSEQGTAFRLAEVGKVENEELADTYNTVLKMGKKRAQVDAVLTATAAGDVFTQDMEDKAPSGEEVARDSDSPPTRSASSDAASSPEGDMPARATQPAIEQLHGLLVAMGKTGEQINEIWTNHCQQGVGYMKADWVADQTEKARRHLERLDESTGSGEAGTAASASPEPEQTSFVAPEGKRGAAA